MVLISNRLLLGSNSLEYDICGYSKEHYVHSYYVSVETISFQEGNNLFPTGGSNKERISALVVLILQLCCGYSKEHYVHSYKVSVETIGFQEGNNLFYPGGSK